MNKISLKAARVNAGLTQKELAERVSKNESTIIKWEKFPNKIPLGDFKKICKELNVNIDQIFFTD